MDRQRKARILWCAALLGMLLAGICPPAPAAESSQDGRTVEMPPTGPVLNSLSDEERKWLRDHPVITLGHDPGWPPIEFSSERGELSGMSGDYVRLVEQRLGVTFERVSNLTWQEVYARQKRWEIDVATCVALTPQRTEFWAFTKPYLSIPIVIATQPEVPYVGEMKELFNKRIAVVEGYAIDDWITKDFPEINLVRVREPQEGLALLQRGDAFAYIDNLLIIGDFQAKGKVTNIKIAGQTPYENAQRMAVRKDWAPLAGILQKALDSIAETERQEIYRKWLPVRYEHGFDYSLLWQSLAVFAAVILVLARWNRRLAKEMKKRQQAEAALQQQAGELAVLHDLGRSVNATLSVAEGTKAGLQGMLRAINPDLAFLFMRDGERLILQDVLPPVARPRLGDIPEHRVGECICGLAVRERKPLYSRDLFQDPRCDWEECKRAGIKSFAALPLSSGDEIVGVIGLASDTERDFERQAGFLETLAGQVAVALENARLFETAQRELAERKRVEEELSVSEQRFRTLAEASFEGIAISERGILLDCSEQMARMVGLGRSEMVGKSVQEFIAPAHRHLVDEAIRSGRLEPYEHLMLRADGTDFPVEVCARSAQIGERQVRITAVRDITQRKQAEEALRAANEQLQALVQSSPVAIIVLDPEGRVKLWNPAAERVFGWTEKEALDRLLPYVTADKLAEHGALRARVLRGEAFTSVEVRRRRKDGTPVDLSVSTAPLRDAQDRITGIMSVNVDVTDRRRAEAALSESEERFASFMRNLPGFAFIKDHNRRVLYVNEQFETAFDLPLPEWRGKTNDEIWPGDVGEKIRRDDEAVLAADQPIAIVEEVPTRGVLRTYRTIKFPIPRPDGRSWLGGISVDITELKQAEEALRSSIAEKESLLAEVHHRVKNNLQVISSLLSLQFRQVKNAAVQSFLRDTQNRIRSMAMLHEVLYRSDSIAHVSFPLYVKGLCEHVARSYGAAARKIRFTQRIADVTLSLEQAITAGLIINELVTNAIKHAFPSRPAGEIRVELQAAGDDRLVLRVSDNGVGFPLDDSIHRDDSLGLLLVRTLSRNLGGQLSAKSEGGGVFEIAFQRNSLEG